MRICAACGHRNSDDVGFCVNCAAALARPCARCGQPIPPGNKFCGNCGARQPEPASPAPPPSDQTPALNLKGLRAMMPQTLARKISAAAPTTLGERREVTVLFVDIADFTARTHQLDSEDVYLFVNEALRLLVDVVYRYEGTIDKFTGDGLMALFGAPVAHENDPERAVRAALDMLTALHPLQARIRQRHNFEVQVRIGINTGPVVAGQVGSDLHMEYTVLGDTVNVASRLQTAADPGTILVSEETYQRTQRLLQYQPLTEVVVKGLTEPLRAARPVAIIARPGRLRGLEGMYVPMIGREAHLGRLVDALDEIRRTGHSQVALITGEAGLGKSRLVAEFRRACESGVAVFEGTCLAYARSRPLWLVADLLRNMLGVGEADPEQNQKQSVRAFLERQGLDYEELGGYLLYTLGLEHSDPALQAKLSQLDAVMLQRQTHAALRQVILAQARARPVALFFDDLHWVDPASREFLEFLIQTTLDASLLIGLVSRDLERQTVLAPLVDVATRLADRFLDLHLKPLATVEARQLIGQMLHNPAAATGVAGAGFEALAEQIVARADGNPFFIEEIIRMLIEQGGLAWTSDGWQAVVSAREVMANVPGTLKGLILARLDRLGDSPRKLLQQAAVIGRSFPLALLETLAPGGAETLAVDIPLLVERQFLDRELFGRLAGAAFRHALVQEVVYSTLLKRDRQELHEQVAASIEARPYRPSDDQVELLAFHYAEGRTPARAVPYLIAAADNAARRYANETAIQHYRHAVTLIQDPAGRWAELARARLGLGQALKFVGQLPEAEHVLKESLAQLELVGPADLPTSLRVQTLRELADVRHRAGAADEAIGHLELARRLLELNAGPPDPALWCSVLDRMAWIRFRQGKLDEAFRLAESATQTAEANRVDEPVLAASLYNTLGGLSWQRGKLPEAITFVERSLQLYSDLKYGWGMANANTNLGVLHASRGMWREAIRYFAASDQLRQETGYLTGRAGNLYNLGELRLVMGDHGQARQDLEACLEIGRRLGEDESTLPAEISLAHLALLQADLEGTAAHLAAAEGLLSNAGEDRLAQLKLLQALLAGERGQVEAGVELARQALDLAQANELPEEEVDGCRTLGQLYARLGQPGEAEAQLRASLALSQKHDNPYRQALAHHQLGRLYANWPGHAAEARPQLQQALTLFARLGAVFDQRRVEADLSRTPASAGADLEVERRRAAIVWVAVQARPGVDAEAEFEALAALVAALSALAEEAGAMLIRRPNGFLLALGLATVREDDVERAVRLAWRFAQRLQEGPAWVPLLETRLAVSLGTVVAGQVGSAAQKELVVTDGLFADAQRLAEAELLGQIWVTEAVYQATRHAFVFERPTGREDAWQLVGARPQPGLARGLPDVSAPLVGRDSWLETLEGFARLLERSVGGLVWIEGEAGIGKSRLMQEFGSRLQARGVEVWAGKCFPQTVQHDLALFAHLLGQAIEMREADTPDELRAKLRQMAAGWPPEARSVWPHLELLLGLPPSDPETEKLANLPPDSLRQQIFVAIRALFKSLAGQRPLALLLDDLQWLDPLSSDLLLFLAELTETSRILLVCARRWDETETPDNRLIRAQEAVRPDQALRVHLERLSETESETLLRGLLAEATPASALRRYVLERSEGNPFYIEEVLRSLSERGRLRRLPDSWDIDPQVNLEEPLLPASLEGLVQARVHRLAPELKRVLQAAAVLGGTFGAELLEAMLEAPLTDELPRLESRGLLTRAGQPPHWQFSHTLIETAVYESILSLRRRDLHARAAAVLLAHWAETAEAHADRLAYHFAQAGNDAQALAYFVLAAEQAARRYAHEEALAYFQQAEHLLSAALVTDDRLRWRVAVGLGDVYRFVGEYDESVAALAVAQPLLASPNLSAAQKAGLGRRLGEAAQIQGRFEASLTYFDQAVALVAEATDREGQMEAARLWIARAGTYQLQGRFDSARQAGDVGRRLAEQAGSTTDLASAENLLGDVNYHLGQLEVAVSHIRQAMALRGQDGQMGEGAATCSNLGILAVLAGDWQAAAGHFQRSLVLQSEMGDVAGLIITHNNLGSLARDRGDLAEAARHLSTSLSMAKALKLAYHLANASLNLADVLLLQGELEEAGRLVQSGMEQATSIGARDLSSEGRRIQARLELSAGDLEAARANAIEAARLAAETGDRRQQAAIWRTVAEVAVQAGQTETARTALLRAQEAVVGLADSLEAGRVAALAARVQRQAGDWEQAETLRKQAEAIFERLGARLDLAHLSLPVQTQPPG